MSAAMLIRFGWLVWSVNNMGHFLRYRGDVRGDHAPAGTVWNTLAGPKSDTNRQNGGFREGWLNDALHCVSLNAGLTLVQKVTILHD